MFMKVSKLMYVVSLVFMLKTATKYEHLIQHFCFRLISSYIRSFAFVCSHQLELANCNPVIKWPGSDGFACVVYCQKLSTF
jgi:hypothetical protein